MKKAVFLNVLLNQIRMRKANQMLPRVVGMGLLCGLVFTVGMLDVLAQPRFLQVNLSAFTNTVQWDRAGRAGALEIMQHLHRGDRPYLALDRPTLLGKIEKLAFILKYALIVVLCSQVSIPEVLAREGSKGASSLSTMRRWLQRD